MNLRNVLVCAAALAVAASTTTLSAQEEKKKGGRGMSAEQRIEQIETAVGKLTADQKSKITAIYAKMQEKMREAGGDREKMGEMMQQVRKDVRAVLTPEQQKKYDEMPQRGGGKRNN